jgi:hypothetical protein
MITQGKWLVSSSTIVCDENARIIANCNPAGIPVLDVPYEDAIDNAALIAAAPDLLEACNEMLDLYVEHAEICSTPDDCPHIAILNKAEQAIAKAEGK